MSALADTRTCDEPMRAAEMLLERAHGDAASVAAEADAALAVTDRDDRAVRAVLLRARGLAGRYLEPIERSIELLREAVRDACAAGRDDLICGARLSLAGSLAISGESDQALAELDAAKLHADPPAAAQIESQRATVLARSGQHERADAAYTAALEIIERQRDTEGLAVTLANRGYLRVFTGRVNEAEADLRAALTITEQREERLPAAFTRHNLGHVALYRGQLATALELFIESERDIAEITGSAHEIQVSRGEALMSAGLFDEAYTLATSIARQMDDAGLQLDLAEAQLLAAEAALAGGRAEDALRAASEATQLFIAQGRPAWSDRARLVALQADGTASSVERRDEARTLAGTLDRAGIAIGAARALTLAVGMSVALGDHETAAADIEQLDRFRSSGPIEVRLAAWHARALGQRAAGRQGLALRSLAAALRLARRHQASLQASDLRAAVARHTRELAQMGCDILVERGDPRALADWAESYRAASLRLDPVDADPGATRTERLAELRAISKQLDGEPGAGTAKLLRRRARLVRELQDESRAFGRDDALIVDAVTVDRIQQALAAGVDGSIHDAAPHGDHRLRQSHAGDRPAAMVQYIETGAGRLAAIVLSASSVDLVALGDLEPIHGARRRLAHALNDVAARRRALRASATALEACDELERRLVQPLARAGCGDLATGARIVVVPTPALFALPWSLIPTYSTCRVTVAPSATHWHRLARSGPRAGIDSARRPPARVGVHDGAATLLASGPDLDHADDEIHAIAALGGATHVVINPASTVTTVLDLLADVDVAHLACHGEHRRGNPLFSRLRLADGDLTIFELEQLRSVPDTVVLSACESAAADDIGGSEMLGLAIAFLSLGTRSLIAGTGLVADSPLTQRLMVALHRGLRQGLPVADAWHAARDQIEVDDDMAMLLRDGSFNVYGA